MLGYLRGKIVGVEKIGARVILLLEVNQVGIEVQIPPRLMGNLPGAGETVQIYTHLQVREDQLVLFGFASLSERDLFRQLVAVSGIGPQLAVALLDSLGLPDLVQAIVTGNVRLLSKTPGVGPKTAERIALELRTKLAEWRQASGLVVAPSAGPVSSVQEDVEMMLLALGYTNGEITTALRAVGQSTALAKDGDAEAWIREAIAWLSR
ncbi:MAG: Holliday junction branch migration protein RuvA [Synechococcales bacterium]|nr:Holliday junction branch migration protein RuvA [Synechococcales bacterium]